MITDAPESSTLATPTAPKISGWAAFKSRLPSQPWDFCEKLFVVVTVAVTTYGASIALKALRSNTESNLAACRSQLYENENLISAREFDKADTKLLSMYAKPAASVTSPDAYFKQLLSVLTDDPRILAIADNSPRDGKPERVEALYDAFYGLDSFKGAARPDIVEMRRMYTHMTTIMCQLHNALDYSQEGVITPKEFETWKGYFTDIGPHPIFLVTIMSWRDQHYLSKSFARLVQREFGRPGTRSRELVAYFYPSLLMPQFLDGLPDYPELPVRG